MFRVLFLIAGIFCVVEAILPPNPAYPSKCNIYKKDLCWVLQDSVCRPMQNPCLRDEENALRIKKGQNPLVPVSKQLCKYFIPKKCRLGKSVTASFPKPAACGCPNKPGTIVNIRFKSFCFLQKYSAETSQAYISYRSTTLTLFKN